MIDLKVKYKLLLKFIEREFTFSPDLAIVLGSGLGDFAGSVEIIKEIPTSIIPEYPAPTILGHKGKIVLGSYQRKNLILFQGRIHFYEQYPLSECILPAFVSFELGCKKILLTNAAGGINNNFLPGDLMLAVSFNATNLKKELADLLGSTELEKKRYLLNFPSDKLNRKIRKSASANNIKLKEGVYWYTKGPSYETPAEIKMISRFGGDAVGMSTVYEAFYAAYKGMDTASVSCITNYAAGISNKKLNHQEVIDTADYSQHNFNKLLKGTIEIL